MRLCTKNESDISSNEQKLTIIHTNDLHGRVNPFKRLGVKGTLGGLARIATIVNKMRDNKTPLLLLDAGDTIHGRSYIKGWGSREEVVIKIMNATGYHAMAVGNHEFDWGIKPLLTAQTNAKFPFLSANLVDIQGKLLFKPYEILKLANLKIGIFSLSTIPFPHPEVVNTVFCLDSKKTIQAARKISHQLRIVEQVDLVILLSHLGHLEDRLVGTTVPGIDLILGGHTHLLLRKPVATGQALLTENGRLGEYISILNLTFAKSGLAIKHRLIRIDATIKADPNIETIIEHTYTNNLSLTKKERKWLTFAIYETNSIKSQIRRALGVLSSFTTKGN